MNSIAEARLHARSSNGSAACAASTCDNPKRRNTSKVKKARTTSRNTADARVNHLSTPGPCHAIQVPMSVAVIANKIAPGSTLVAHVGAPNASRNRIALCPNRNDAYAIHPKLDVM